MQGPVHSLIEALGVESREHIALVGGGGKTTLMFSLAEELRRLGKRVVITTTTKVSEMESRQSQRRVFIGQSASWHEALMAGLNHGDPVFLAESIREEEIKIAGVDPSMLNHLFNDQKIDYLLVEADGAAGHPVKAPADHEPVVPDAVTSVVALMGLEALGKPLSPKIAFRFDLCKQIAGIEEDEILQPVQLARFFLKPEGLFKGIPEKVKKIAFLNKADLLEDLREAESLAVMLMDPKEQNIERVIVGSMSESNYFFME